MPLSKPQKEIVASPARFKVVAAARRFGKSWVALHLMAKAAIIPGSNVFYVAPTFRQAKQVLWEDCKRKFLRVNWVSKINESELTITLKNGSRIFLRSAENGDIAMRGSRISYIVLDESAFMTKEFWTETIRPALSDQKGGALFISSPTGKNWFYDLWLMAHHQPGWEAFQFTTLEGGNVEAEELEMARADMDERTFRQEFLAKFENYEGVIYYNFDVDRNIKVDNRKLTKKEVIHIGIDFNNSPITACIARMEKTHVHIIDEISILGSNTWELCEEIRNRYPDNPIVAYPDATGSAKKTSSNTSDHNIIRQFGFTLRSRSINPKVKDRIASVNALLKAANGDVRLTVDPKCKHVLQGLAKHSYKLNSQIPDKSNNLDHMMDCLGYVIHYNFPIKGPQPRKATSPQIFRHF